MNKFVVLPLMLVWGASQSAEVTYSFTGTLYPTPDSIINATFNGAQDFSGTLTIETSTPSSGSNDYSSAYRNALIALTLDIGDYSTDLNPTYSVTGTSDNRPIVTLFNDMELEQSFRGLEAGDLVDRLHISGGLSAPAANGSYGYFVIDGFDGTAASLATENLLSEGDNLDSFMNEYLQLQITFLDNPSSGHDVFGRFTSFTSTTTDVPTYSCVGFEPPANSDVFVRKPNRVLPLRMTLLDEHDQIVFDIDGPVLEIDYVGTHTYDPSDLEELNFAGRGDEGNIFQFDGSEWAFNLSTKGLASGEYTIRAVSGGAYAIDPACEVVVAIQ